MTELHFFRFHSFVQSLIDQGLVGDFVIRGKKRIFKLRGKAKRNVTDREGSLSWELEKEDGIPSPRNRDPKDRHLERAVLEAVKAIP
jgi:hypothetical protein